VLLVILCCLAEDCIRYRNVTGVQTCALPISFDDLLGGHNGFGNDWGFGSNILWLLWFSNLFHDLFLAAFDLLNRNNFLNQFFSFLGFWNYFSDFRTTFDDLLSGHNGLGYDWSFGTQFLGLLWFTKLFHHLSFAAFDLLNRNNFLNQFLDRKSTRLNSSHVSISYAVFCLKKKKIIGSNYPYFYYIN